MRIVNTRIQNLRVVGQSSSAVATDEYFNLVALLLPGNGTNGQTNNTFLDSSTNAFTITRAGNTTQGTFSPFSQTGWSGYFDGTGDYLSFTKNTTTGSFTCECWFYRGEDAAGGYHILFSGSNLGSLNPDNVQFQVSNTGGVAIAMNGVVISPTGTAVTKNQWNHIAYVRSGSSLAIFVNGSRIATGTSSAALNVVYVGTAVSTYQPIGYISNARIVNAAVYDPASTSITVPTTPLTAIANTYLLTCQSNRFIDNSANAFAITVAGNTSVQAFAPFNPTTAYAAGTVGGSGYFDGSGDYLTAPDNATFNFGSNDFTIEMWVYPTAVGQAVLTLLYAKPNGSGYSGIIIGQEVSGYGAVFYASSTGTSWNLASAASIGTMIPNAWNHIVVSRSGTNIRGFLNGNVGSTTAVSTTALVSTSGTVSIGSSNGTASTYVTGYISGLRVLNGTGYTSITVPTAPPTAITNTSLLLNYTNGGITDATAKNVFETVDGAQISTAQSKFGGSAMLFDGTGDWLLTRTSPNLDMGTGDLTIEGWFYLTTAPADYQMIVSSVSADGSGAVNYITIRGGGTGGQIEVNAFNGSFRFNLNNSVSANTWFHLAVTRSTNTWYGFINGTSVGSTTNSNIFNLGNGGMYVGRFGGGTAYAWPGYMDDLRITKGYARYTANFTPPTTAFPTQ